MALGVNGREGGEGTGEEGAGEEEMGEAEGWTTTGESEGPGEYMVQVGGEGACGLDGGVFEVAGGLGGSGLAAVVGAGP